MNVVWLGNYLGEEIFGGAIISDGFLVRGVDHDTEVARGVEVVLVP